MKTILKKVDTFLILFSALINTIVLTTIPFNHDSIGIVAMIQFLIAVYTMFISAPVWLTQLNSNSKEYKKRLIHFCTSLIYLAFIIIVMQQFKTSDYTKLVLLIVVPQLLLYFYCSFYIIDKPFLKVFKSKTS